MKLSIIIVHFNTPGLLEQCLNSLIEKRLPGDWEVIVVDNASTIFKQYANVQIIKNKENLGFSKANNIGIQKSSGQYVLLLNPDTVVSQRAIRRVIDYTDQHTDGGVATCRVELSGGELDDACHRGFPTPWNAFCHFSGIASLFPHSTIFNGYHLGYQNMHKIHEIDACAGAFMLIRRSAGEEVNWLDEEYFWYGEDIDICYRLKQKAWKVLYIPDVKIVHYKGMASGIKKQTAGISKADEFTKAGAQKARFDAMRIFYRKHYLHQYPRGITFIVDKGIALLGWIHKV